MYILKLKYTFKLSQFLLHNQIYVRFAVVIIEYNIFSVHHYDPFNFNSVQAMKAEI